jgi:8-oxo-dGTP pyrophosphatase MutT (NUDIX family)
MHLKPERCLTAQRAGKYFGVTMVTERDRPIRDHIPTGGVVFRRKNNRLETVLISVGESRRWQLPRSRIHSGETNEVTAARAVREETGPEVDQVAPIDSIDYRYSGDSRGHRCGFTKWLISIFLNSSQGAPGGTTIRSTKRAGSASTGPPGGWRLKASEVFWRRRKGSSSVWQ